MHPAVESPKRVLVADPHPIVRLGIRALIEAEPTLSMCREAEYPEAALRFATHSSVDLVITELSFDRGSGLELIGGLRRAAPDLPVLVLTVHDEGLYAERALRIGARGYIMKQESIEHLAGAIKRVLSGQFYVSERLSQRLLERVGDELPPAGDAMANLTTRELEVLRMIGRGLRTAAIAHALRLSVKTIETYRSNIKSKLHLTNAIELLRYAAIWAERL